MSKRVLEEGPQRNLRQDLQPQERRRRTLPLVHDVVAVLCVCHDVGAGSQKQPGAQHEARVCDQLTSKLTLMVNPDPFITKLDALCGEDGIS